MSPTFGIYLTYEEALLKAGDGLSSKSEVQSACGSVKFNVSDYTFYGRLKRLNDASFAMSRTQTGQRRYRS